MTQGNGSQFIAPATKPITAEDFAGTDNTSIWWLSGAGFLINSRGTLIMIDPVLTMKPGSPDICEIGHRMLVPLPIVATEVPRLDTILYSHLDDDHLAPVTAPALIRTGGLFAGPVVVVRELANLGIPAEQYRSFRINETLRIGEVEISFTRVDHSWQNLDPEKYGPPYGPEDCYGFLIKTPDGTIWYTGDSRLLPEHLEMSGVDLLLLDISNDPYHFGIENAVKLANTLASADIIAHHYGTYDGSDVLAFNGNPDELASAIDGSESRFHVLAPGERYVLKG
ncbi:MBL fold metallo-hydrolase [Paenibacillus solisilvae]|uniref:MBL fold metallo-hydrolase n=1 Tax=Paenibacillus solisilvae TaxID=2486751 RepID=A0ABW0VQ63_9BACL